MSDDNVCTISSKYYEYRQNIVILGHGNGDEDWYQNIDNSNYDPIDYRRSLGFDELPEDYKSFKEPDEYVGSKICPNRCFEYCWFLSDDNILPQDSSIKFQRKCAGFSFFGNSTHYSCYFEVGNEEYSPRLVKVGNLFKRAFPSARLDKSGTTLNELNGVGDSESEKVIKGSFFRLPIPSPPPPGIPGEIVPPPISPPIASPPPPSIENLILRPIILIPLIVGSVLFLILFIYIFRLCTRERADAFNRVIRSLTRRKNNRVVIDTSKKVEVKRSARK